MDARRQQEGGLMRWEKKRRSDGEHEPNCHKSWATFDLARECVEEADWTVRWGMFDWLGPTPKTSEASE
ncbi:hypothetical protein MJO28_006490 [Puccinia striiformis f. sp. tritici]|uniref:Uncharacterized protein n=1 Tax=Puccinia striiformis f. sp. tritici TaxID=168172 RepID=A0ACC0EH71_9BASI|nr:hypothetical protein MJO28_006490 [Puccinia striiformis f. sp. tritici]